MAIGFYSLLLVALAALLVWFLNGRSFSTNKPAPAQPRQMITASDPLPLQSIPEEEPQVDEMPMPMPMCSQAVVSSPEAAPTNTLRKRAAKRRSW